MSGIVDSCLMPFAIALGATSAQVANLGSLPNLTAAIVQSQATGLMDWLGSRKNLIISAILAQTFFIAAMAFLPAFPASDRVTALVGLAMFYIMLGALVSPVWGSLMCEYLPPSRRSGYFGWRNQVLGAIIVAAGFSAGLILQAFSRVSLKGFVILFSMAALLRICSWMNLRRMFDPHHEWHFRERRTRLRFDPGNRKNFFRFLIFGGVMMAGVQLCGPLQAVYFLKSLQIPYITYMSLICASNFTMFYMMKPWGKHADISGNLNVIRSVSYFMPVIPLMLLVSKSSGYLFTVQLVSGVAWAGYNLCITNFIYDAVPPAERVRATALYNMVNGIGFFLGAMLGGQLIDILPPVRGFPYLTLCILSSFVRLLAVIIFLPGIQEVRRVQQVRSMDLFYSVIGLKPIPGIPRSTLLKILQPSPQEQS